METTEATETPKAAQRKLAMPAAGDMIGSLPDEILSHILHFLPTKYAVGTSVLSRRWKDLWTGLYELDLDNRDRGLEKGANVRKRQDLEGFCRFANRVLRKHKDLNSLRRFRFRLAVGCLRDEGRPNFSLRMRLPSADESQLEEMDVKFEGYNLNGSGLHMRWLPKNFYRLKLLKVLKLEGVTMETTTTTKGSVILLPSVKILQIVKAEVRDCELLSNLISGCPVLETLHVENCYSLYKEEKTVVTAPLSSLKNLRIIGCPRSKNPLCPIEIEAPSLEHLYLRHFAEIQFLGTGGSPLPCLHSAQVQMGLHQISKHDLITLLAQISDAKQIMLSWQIQCILSDDVDDDVQLPIFPNLTYLTIELGRASGILYSMLKAASKLQYLGVELCNDTGAMEWEQATTPECLLSSLEEIRIEQLVARHRDQVKIVAYLLKAGAVLKKVNLHVDCYDDAIEDRFDFVSLLRLPRGSSSCEAHLFLPNGEEFCIGSDSEINGEDEDDDDDEDDRTKGDEIDTDDNEDRPSV